jgi:multidrug resistance protein
MPSKTTLIPMQPGVIVLLLALLLGLQPVTTDLYLPALPVLSVELGAPMPQAQLTLTALLLAFGLSQLVWGPLSDQYGRRPILLVGLCAYVLASIGAALSPGIFWLIIWRTVQGVAMGAGVMCARAIVRDLYPPTQGARVMSKGLSGLGLIACLSAPLGGLLTEVLNWRYALLALAVFGAASLAVVALQFEETVPQKNPHALRLPTLLSTWKIILRNHTFLAFSALSAASYGGLFTFLAASSFGRHGARNAVALRQLAAQLQQHHAVLHGFHALRPSACRWKAPGQAEHPFQNGQVVRVVQHVAHKALVDLQHLRGQALEVGQRRIAGAKVVQRKRDAHVGCRPQHLDLPHVLPAHWFPALQLQPRGLHLGWASSSARSRSTKRNPAADAPRR